MARQKTNPRERLVKALIDDVEALCRVYVGKDAESEEWGTTCERLEHLDRLIKRIRRDEAKSDEGRPA